jgi:hypothetical protein
MILNRFVIAERPVVLADTSIFCIGRCPILMRGVDLLQGVRPMMAKWSAFGVIVATGFIRSSIADLPYPALAH